MDHCQAREGRPSSYEGIKRILFATWMLMAIVPAAYADTHASANKNARDASPQVAGLEGQSLEDRVERLEGLLKQLLNRMTAADAQLGDQAAKLVKEAEEIKELQVQMREEHEHLKKVDEEVREVASNVNP